MRPVRKDLLEHVARLRHSDPEVMEEVSRRLSGRTSPSWSKDTAAAMRTLVRADDQPLTEGLALAGSPQEDLEYESIAIRLGRPAYVVSGGKPVLSDTDDDSEVWRKRLDPNDPLSKKWQSAVLSVGRINMQNHPAAMPYAGTGWVIDNNVIVTNRHVARVFAQSRGQGFEFRTGFDRTNKIGVDWDPIVEFGSTASNVFRITRVLYIASDAEGDIAFLGIEPAAGQTPLDKIVLFDQALSYPTMVAVVGYPARDDSLPDQSLMERIFGGVYGKKRFSPGFANNVDGNGLSHDCTTLGGNSGAPVIDLASGAACGLHYSGIFLKRNYAVPIAQVAKLLDRARYPGTTTSTSEATHAASVQNVPPAPPRPPTQGTQMTTQPTDGGRELRVTIPIEITVRVGDNTPVAVTVGGSSLAVDRAASSLPSAAPPSSPSSLVTFAGSDPAPQVGSIGDAVVEAQRLLGRRADVLLVEAGWKFVDGWITDVPAVVISVRDKVNKNDLVDQGLFELPREILGVPVDVRTVALLDQHERPVNTEALTEVAWTSSYKKWPEVPLKAVTEDMVATLHAGPDAGWPLLSEFLGATTQSLTIGMYDFTAQHIVTAVKEATEPAGRALSLVLQRGEDIGKGTKQHDITDADTVQILRDAVAGRFEFAWASVQSQGALFQTSYHIKVAVRDSAAFWLSSGNWQSSNQPPQDPINGEDTKPPLQSTCNREWHVIVENEKLAAVFEKYLKRDRAQAAELGGEEAVGEPEAMVWVPEDMFQPTLVELEAPIQYHPPLRLSKKLKVQPLLTPDNYPDEVLKLIQSAKERILFQNQSFGMKPQGQNPPKYEALLQALLQKQSDGLDVRVIFRRIGDVRTNVSNIRTFGFDTSKLRLQTNCHTKGIVIDDKAVLVGSQNWTGAGTTTNRDASLIFYDREAAEYYADLFEYDWGRAGAPKIDESLPAPILASSDEGVARPRMVLMPLSKWLGED